MNRNEQYFQQFIYHLTQQFNIIGHSFPLIKDQLKSQNEQILQTLQNYLNGQEQRCLVGDGPKATALKEAFEVIPEFLKITHSNVEFRYESDDLTSSSIGPYPDESLVDDYIKERLPKTYGHREHGFKAFKDYVKYHLADHAIDEYRHEWLRHHENVWELSRSNPFFRPDGVKSHFQLTKVDKYIGYETQKSIVLKLHDTCFQLNNDGDFQAVVYVPIEEKWVEVHEDKYLDFIGLKEAFDQLLEDHQLQLEPVNWTNVFLWIDQQVQEILSQLDVKDKSKFCVYDKIGFYYIATDASGTLTKDFNLLGVKTANSRNDFSLTTSEENPTPIIGGYHMLDTLPVRIQHQVKAEIETLIEKVKNGEIKTRT